MPLTPLPISTLRALLVAQPDLFALVGDRISVQPEPGIQLPAIFMKQDKNNTLARVQQGDPRRNAVIRFTVVGPQRKDANGQPLTAPSPDWETTELVGNVLHTALLYAPGSVVGGVRIYRAEPRGGNQLLDPVTNNPLLMYSVECDLAVTGEANAYTRPGTTIIDLTQPTVQDGGQVVIPATALSGTTSERIGVPYPGAAVVASDASALVVSHTASGDEALTGFVASSTGDGMFSLTVEGVVVATARVSVLQPSVTVALPSPVLLGHGHTVELRVHSLAPTGDATFTGTVFAG